jgi:hypothetical protein
VKLNKNCFVKLSNEVNVTTINLYYSNNIKLEKNSRDLTKPTKNENKSNLFNVQNTIFGCGKKLLQTNNGK